jgi:polysaccharide biosynthesis/export protein
MNRILIAVFLTGALASAAAAWGQAPRVGKEQPAAAPKNEVNSNTQAKPVDPNVGVGVNPTAYVIGGEDVLYIRTWRQPDFTFPAVVRPDGKISVPLVGEVQAADKTPSVLEKELSAALGNYIQKPEVTVTVTDVRSKKYYVNGEVVKAGEFALVGPTTVLQAISQCGFQPFANKKKIRILRGNTTLKFNYEEVIRGKNVEQNILVQNGDYIIVP